MSQMQEIRSFYLDSQWTQRNANGSFSLLLDEQIEVANSQVMFLDEVSVIGSIPMVNINNQKLYVVEQSPRGFDFAQSVVALDTLTGTPFRTAITISARSPPRSQAWSCTSTRQTSPTPCTTR